MPKNKVSDPITDQEMAFAHLVLSGTMTDRAAAEAVGLNPESAAYIKSKPRVRAYMAEHRAAVREKLVLEESEGLRKLNVGRDKVLERLWELATLPPDVTRGNINGQLKAIAMFSAMGGLFPAAHPERSLSSRPSRRKSMSPNGSENRPSRKPKPWPMSPPPKTHPFLPRPALPSPFPSPFPTPYLNLTRRRSRNPLSPRLRAGWAWAWAWPPASAAAELRIGCPKPTADPNPWPCSYRPAHSNLPAIRSAAESLP